MRRITLRLPSAPLRRAAAVCTALAALAAFPALARDCAVRQVSGASAEFWHEGDWRPLAAAPLPAAEVIVRTGPDARAEIACDDGVVVTVGADSEVNLATLTAPQGDARSVLIGLLRGIVGLTAEGSWSSFSVRAPLVVATIRSTEWFVEHVEGRGSAVFVREGEVAVRGAGRAVVLRPGEGVDVAASDPPVMSPVRNWGAGRVEAAGERLGFGWR